ncbi:N-acetylmuramoyl-L-alanine amidase [Luteimonas panaciterrae]|uniref:N-acetylmuramoyl-L-alanine amidase n=1 Tax=Luteimonas panaciterrae TaxID=363885 RepID=UPI001CF9AF02|nr:peptidoglycan recognition family protein [Luteimonas panaciterrae]
MQMYRDPNRLAVAMLLACASATSVATAASPAETSSTLVAADQPVRAQAQAALNTQRIQRAHYPAFFQRAYARYPDLPRGVLEAIAYNETGWNNVAPGEKADHRHMPAAWGVMGLYHGEGFADQVSEGAKLLGVPVSLVMRDPETNILAAAALLDRASKENKAIGEPSAKADQPETMSAVLARYVGYGPGSGQIYTYARQSFAYGVLSSLRRGVSENGIAVPARAVKMERAFSPNQLSKLRVPALRMNADEDTVELDNAPPTTSKSTVTANATLAGDFGEAIWNPASSSNYSTASNSMTAVIMHTMEGSYAGAISWFQNPSAQVSAHYLIRKSDGQITQMVREYHQAWHAKYHNYYTIGIEHDGYASDAGNWSTAMVNASARLTSSICARRGVNCASAWQGPGYDTWHVVPDSVRVKGHGMLTQNENRYDPGKYFPWASYYSLINGGTPPPPTTDRFWVDTYANAPGYGSPTSTTQTGTLNAGTNYVFCKAWGREVRNGDSFNHWWLKTDLDVGPAGQWVSAYYLSRWGNDEAKDNNGAVIPDCATAPPPPSTSKYWVDTYANASGYASPTSTTATGTLNAGTNYVFCKAWGRQIGSGSSYNHWWLKTDLDVGPAGQWVSAYYLSRWGNDEAKDNNGTVIPDC